MHLKIPFCLTFTLLLFCYASMTRTSGAASTQTIQQLIGTMKPLPAVAGSAIDMLLAFAGSPHASFDPAVVAPLVDFVRSSSVSDSGWELPARNGAAGSAYILKVKAALRHYLTLNFHPGIPDYAVFPSALRYSASLDSNAMQQAYASIRQGPTGTLQYAASRMIGMEEITPNPESGSYFSYTNSRVFLRCKVNDHDVLFSCAETLAPSTFSNRGVIVGPLEQALFYYSEKPGLNLPGMTWMLSQIRHSTTLSVYVALNSNETAVATFAWLNAGWKGLNVTRPGHILNSQKTTLDFSRRIAEDPRVSAPALTSIVETVNAMTPSEVDQEYERYLAYVRSWSDRSKQPDFCHASLLRDLYNPQNTQSVALPHRRALIVQERLRVLMHIPTWTREISAHTVAFH